MMHIAPSPLFRLGWIYYDTVHIAPSPSPSSLGWVGFTMIHIAPFPLFRLGWIYYDTVQYVHIAPSPSPVSDVNINDLEFWIQERTKKYFVYSDPYPLHFLKLKTK